MDYDSDSDRDRDGVWDVYDGSYGGDVHDYYHDDYNVGDFDADDIIGVDNFHDALDVDIHAGDDLYGGDDSAAEFGGDDRDLAADFGIDGGDNSDGDVDIAAELGLDDGDYFNEIRDLAGGFEVRGGDYDVDGDGFPAVEVSSTVGDGFNVDRDFEAEFGVLGGNGDRNLLEAEFGVTADDIYGVDSEEAMTGYLIDIGAHGLVPVAEVDDDDEDNDDSDDYHNYNNGDELVPVVEVDDVVVDYYFSGRSGGEHLRVEDLDAEPLYMDNDLDFLLSRDNNTSTREITIQALPLMNSSSNGGVEHLVESNSNPNARRNEKEKDGNLASSSEEAKKDTNANESENDAVSCPICLEPWTTDGDHIICCLPCGHVYGMSCIKSWLQQPNSGKCPVCNKVCSVEGIRKIYGLTIVTVEKDLKEKIQLLEARCASLELNNGDRQRKEAELRQSEAVLLQQPKTDTNN